MPLEAQPVALLFTTALAVTEAGAVIVTVAVAVHPLLSVTVTVYEPAERLLAEALVPPLGNHAYV